MISTRALMIITNAAHDRRSMAAVRCRQAVQAFDRAVIERKTDGLACEHVH